MDSAYYFCTFERHKPQCVALEDPLADFFAGDVMFAHVFTHADANQVHSLFSVHVEESLVKMLKPKLLLKVWVCCMNGWALETLQLAWQPLPWVYDCMYSALSEKCFITAVHFNDFAFSLSCFVFSVNYLMLACLHTKPRWWICKENSRNHTSLTQLWKNKQNSEWL